MPLTPALDLLSPEDWRSRLLDKLQSYQPQGVDYLHWYRGDYPPPTVSTKYAAAYQLLLDISRNAWSRLIVDAIAERLTIQGVTLDTEANSQLAWRVLTRNRVDAQQRLVHGEALLLGTGYVSVWPDPETGLARVVPETALEVTHEPDPADGSTVAVIKCWRDPLALNWRVDLIVAEGVFKWAASDSATDRVEAQTMYGAATDLLAGGQRLADLAWSEYPETDGGWPAPNPTGQVTIIPFENRPMIYGGGQSEIADLIPIMQRIDKLTLDMLLAAETAAFRQKWATGLEVPVDPTTGNRIEPFKVATDRLWVSDSPDTKFGSFESTNLDPYLKAVDSAVAALAAISRVPSHYLLQQSLANPPSADALRAGEAGLVAKVHDRMLTFGESWENVTALAMSIDNVAADSTTELGVSDIDIVWKNPELRNEAQVADAALKWSQVGVPQEAVWEKLGASPDDVRRWRVMSAQEALTDLLRANVQAQVAASPIPPGSTSVVPPVTQPGQPPLTPTTPPTPAPVPPPAE